MSYNFYFISGRNPASTIQALQQAPKAHPEPRPRPVLQLVDQSLPEIAPFTEANVQGTTPAPRPRNRDILRQRAESIRFKIFSQTCPALLKRKCRHHFRPHVPKSSLQFNSTVHVFRRYSTRESKILTPEMQCRRCKSFFFCPFLLAATMFSKSKYFLDAEF